MGCSIPCAAVFNQLSPEKGGDALGRDVKAVAFLFLLVATVAMLASGGLMGFLMCCAAISIVLKIRSEL